MITSDLYRTVLFEPLTKHHANHLKIVSGYSSPAMLAYHIDDMEKEQRFADIDIIVGMTAQDGLYRGSHLAFKEMMSEGYRGVPVKCGYICKVPAVHSKLYIWEKDEKPISAFLGSANYSQNAFVRCSTREVLIECDPEEALEYFNALDKDRIFCTHPDVEEIIEMTSVRRGAVKRLSSQTVGKVELLTTMGSLSTEAVTLSFLDADTGEVPSRSGLNWGQRPGRDPNQAYISVPVQVMRQSFFPNRTEQFTVQTDDDKIIICVTAQSTNKGDPNSVYKAIHSTLNNSRLGEYFRYRMGLPYGAFVTKEDLQRYGRTDVTFYRIDQETYYMDFSV
jgi:HKD family nuclease